MCSCFKLNVEKCKSGDNPKNLAIRGKARDSSRTATHSLFYHRTLFPQLLKLMRSIFMIGYMNGFANSRSRDFFFSGLT